MQTHILKIWGFKVNVKRAIYILLLISFIAVPSYAQEVNIYGNENNTTIFIIRSQNEPALKDKNAPSFFIAPVFYWTETYYDTSDVNGETMIEDKGVRHKDIIDTIHISARKNRMTSFGVKAGKNIYPFFNVYALYLHTEGKAISEVLLRDRELYNNGVSSMQSGPHKVKTETDFSAETAGVGTDLTYEVPNIFSALGIFGTFSAGLMWSNIPSLQETKSTVAASAKFGIMCDMSIFKKFAAWAGVEYMKTFNEQEEIEGTITVPAPDSKDPDIKSYDIKYKAKSAPASTWNMTAGLRLYVNKYIDLSAEAVFPNKVSVMTAISVRF